ncbi:MAG: winged helix-turn-helix domain-containing protein [Anaerolineae bacterium]|nr:winged helix-turn-helix domain-containing protein [Anaerolineae bacterium]
MNIPTLDELSLLHQQICTAVGDPKRIQILYALHEQPMNVSALADMLGMPQPTVSRHLGILRERSLVINEREGAAVIYRIRDTRIIDVLDTMRQVLRGVLEARASKLT